MTSSSDNPKRTTITEYAECPYCSYKNSVVAGGTTFWCPNCEHFFDESESDDRQTIIEGFFLEDDNG